MYSLSYRISVRARWSVTGDAEYHRAPTTTHFDELQPPPLQTRYISSTCYVKYSARQIRKHETAAEGGAKSKLEAVASASSMLRSAHKSPSFTFIVWKWISTALCHESGKVARARCAECCWFSSTILHGESCLAYFPHSYDAHDSHDSHRDRTPTHFGSHSSWRSRAFRCADD